jgi:predicted lipoprotein with Yx(FWY)xxD motif
LRTRISLAIAVVALVALAGCGSSSQSSSSSGSAAGGGYGVGGTPATTTTGASATTTTASGGGAGVAIATEHTKLGTILVAGPKKMTVYLFEKDKTTASTCDGACAGFWPPVTTSAAATAEGAAMSSELGTTTRSDGTKQVTYHGHPLYFFVKDTATGDTTGQGLKKFGAEWYVLKPSGEKVDES